MKKRCYKCKTTKSIDEFYNDKSSRDGHNSLCKECHRIYTRVNKAKRRAYKKAYNKNGKGNFAVEKPKPIEKSRAIKIYQSASEKYTDKWDLLYYLTVEYGAFRAVSIIKDSIVVPEDDVEYIASLEYLYLMN